jgi:uncharacterized protein
VRGGEQERTASQWPAWFGPVGALIAFFTAATAAGVLTALDVSGDDELDGGPFTTVVATLVQDTMLVLVAVALALQHGRPNLADFGWRPAPWGRCLRVLVIGVVAFYGFALAFGALVKEPGEQDVLEALGADRGGAYLLLSAIIVIVLAPISEETFFRGFFYRGLRNRFGVAGGVTLVALVFGAIHYSGPDTLVLLPVLAVLGAIFCLMYELSGSLLPAVGLHTINNGITFAATAPSGDAALISVAAAGGTALAAAALLTAGTRRTV